MVRRLVLYVKAWPEIIWLGLFLYLAGFASAVLSGVRP